MTIATASGATEGTVQVSGESSLLVMAARTWGEVAEMRMETSPRALWADVLRSIGESSLGFLSDEPELYSDEDGEPV
jgi:hypothetical protein